MRLGLFILVHTFMTMNASKNAVLVQNTVSTLKLFGRQVFIKRDDLQFKHNEGLSGNKGRKFRSLLTSDEQHTHILSYGGYQSNAMLALSQIATIRKCSLHYFTQTIPAHLKEEPIGNHLQAIKLGTKIVEVNNETYNAIRRWSETGANMVDFRSVFGPVMSGAVEEGAVQWIPQGGSMPSAQAGVYGLGEELLEFTATAGMQGPWKIVVACGTGTTAYFLARFFAQYSNTRDIQVLAVPCVGTSKYLSTQMEALDRQCGSTGVLPTVLSSETAPKRTFAKPTREHMAIWKSLHRQSGIEFDLIYAPRAWEVLLSSASPDKATVSAVNADEPLLRDWAPDANIIYYHCGGVEGNPSQMSRYKYLGLD